MKLLVLLSLLSSSFFAQAETLTIYEGDLNSYRGMLETRVQFQMDTRTAQGYVTIAVDGLDRFNTSFPRRRCDIFGCQNRGPQFPRTYKILRKKIIVENLKLVGKDMIYLGENGEVNCGKLGTSRVLRRPTLKLNGNCKLRYKTSYRDIKVTLKIK